MKFLLSDLQYIRKKSVFIWLSLVVIFGLLKTGDCVVFLSSVSSVSVGSTTQLYCNLTGEVPGSFSWKRYYYNGSSSITLNLGTTINPITPARYTLNVVGNTSYLLYSTIVITGVTSDDFVTFECTASSTAKLNLTELVVVLVTTDTTTLCLNDSYNTVLYVLIIFSNIALAIALVFIYQFISEPTNLQLLILYACYVISFMLLVIMILFWISPSYINRTPEKVWSPIVIVPTGCASMIIYWVAILYFISIVYKYESIIELPILIVIAIFCFAHLFLIAVILSSITYCTGTSSFSSLSTNYSVVSDICAGLLLLFALANLLIILWKHKGSKKIIGIKSASYPNVRDHSMMSGFFGIKSDHLSPTSTRNFKDETKKSEKVDKDKEKQKQKGKEKDKEKEKDKKEEKVTEKEKNKDKGKVKETEKSKKEKTSKLPELQNGKTPDTSFGSMDFDQNDLRRSTPNADEVESVPKTANPLLMNFIKNSADPKNLESIREETPEVKNKTALKTPKTTTKVQKSSSKDENAKDSSRSTKDKKDKKNDEKSVKKKSEEKKVENDSDDLDSLNGDGASNNELFPIEPLSEEPKKTNEKAKKAGKGKTKPKE